MTSIHPPPTRALQPSDGRDVELSILQSQRSPTHWEESSCTVGPYSIVASKSMTIPLGLVPVLTADNTVRRIVFRHDAPYHALPAPSSADLADKLSQAVGTQEERTLVGTYVPSALCSIQSTQQALQLFRSVEMVDCWLWHQVTHSKRKISHMNQMPFLYEV
ncbi:hypothetical protein V6N11_072563 [Hibiscus sabdariffa]|uniref:Uncharacterized protein n=1 Tax=Hibiscus sabdariffa TaxID=183260 RepID=A0ABR2U3G8_9ROSI